MSLIKFLARPNVGRMKILEMRFVGITLPLRTLASLTFKDVSAVHLASSVPACQNIHDQQQVSNFMRFYGVRHYAKKAKDSSGKKDQASSKKAHRSSEKPTIQLTAEELNEVINFDKMRQQMDMALDHLKKDYAEQLSLRTSAAVFDSLTVETQDGKFSLIEIAQVIQKSPQLMLINMAATPQYITQVKTAIANSGLNVNVQQDGTSLFVPIPRVTREHREALAKNAKTLCDKTKEKLRNIQNNFARELKKAKDSHSEDLIFNLHETVLTTTKGYMDKAEEVMKAKQQELLSSN